MSSHMERRRYPRVGCRLPVVSQPGSPALEGIVCDLSLDGLRLQTAQPVKAGEIYPVHLILPSRSAPLHLEIKAIGSGSGVQGDDFRFQFARLGQLETRLLKQFILEQMTVEQQLGIQQIFRTLNNKNIQSLMDTARIRSLLSKAAAAGSTFTFVQEDRTQQLKCQLEMIAEGELRFTHQGFSHALSFELDVPAVVVFTTDFNSFYFETFLSGIEAQRLQAEAPEAIFFPEKRSAERRAVPVPGNAIMMFTLPYPKDQVVKNEVVDISSAGLSFHIPPDEKYYLPGTPIPEIQVVCEGQEIVRHSAEVRHVTPLAEDGKPVVLKVGLEFGVNRQNVSVTKTGLKLEERPIRGRRQAGGLGKEHLGPERRSEPSGERRDVVVYSSKLSGPISAGSGKTRPGALLERESPVRVVRYSNQHNEPIVAILNATFSQSEKRAAPVVIVPPAYGRRKESTGNLALALIENFKQHEQHLVVLRYDGIRSIGESHRDPSCQAEGREMVNMTLGQGMEDILTTLDFVTDNPYFEATDIILVSFSLGACIARKALVSDTRNRVGYWISGWGAADAQEVIRNSSGGVDFIGNYQKGIRCGIVNVLGHLIDNDRFCEDAFRNGMANLDGARRDMARIAIPVTWFYGKYDAWINPDRIRDIMSIQSGGPREVIELPTGHMPTSSDQALEAYQLITRKIWQHLFIEDIEVQPPSQSAAVELRNAEWSRTPKSAVKDQTDYWEKYLLGEGQLEVGFDVMAETQEYQEFMRKQAQLLDIRAGEAVADLGSGTGLFHFTLLNEEKYRSLFQNGVVKAPRILTVDFVDSALEKSEKKTGAWGRRYGIDTSAFEFRLANLEVSRLMPVWRFLRGEYFSVVKLKGKIEGFPDYLPGLWAKNYSELLHEILRGKRVDGQDFELLKREFSEPETDILLEINRAARFLLRQLVQRDFKDPQLYEQLLHDGQLDYSELDASHLEFGRLNFRNSASDMALPFEDQQFDKILCSIVLSYLFNPEESLREFYRMLKPGGRLVISTFRPDMDISITYTNLIVRIESEPDYVPPDGMSREVFLNAARAFANSAAFLLHLEEEGHFRFFRRSELEGLLLSAGFRGVEFHEAFGYPPQAYVATCCR